MASPRPNEHPRPTIGPEGREVTPSGTAPKWEMRKSPFRADFPVVEFMDWLVAECAGTGLTPKMICKTHPKAPSYRTLMSWVAQDADFERKYLAAQRVGVHCRIEKLVGEAEELMRKAKAGGLNKDEVNAFSAYARTIQWMAGKWNKETYGEHAQTRTIVPVQIVTNLDFGQPGVRHDNPADLYTVELEAQIAEPEAEDESVA